MYGLHKIHDPATLKSSLGIKFTSWWFLSPLLNFMVKMAARLSTIELLSLDSAGLQKKFEAGLLTSVELVQACLAQISKHDQQGTKLNAMISIVPDRILMERSAQLDRERAAGLIRSPFHGIPILIKVCRFEALYYSLKLLTFYRMPLQQDLR